MKELWNKNLRSSLFLFCGLYTAATIVNSVLYLCRGIYEDPSGNRHELDRAVLVLVAVLAYVLIKHVKGNFFLVKAVIVYVPTMLLIFLYVFLRGQTTELAKTAYRDVFFNYTIGFVAVSAIFFAADKLRKRKRQS